MKSLRFFQPTLAALGWGVAVLMLAFVPTADGQGFGQLPGGQEKHLSFKVDVSPSDPFSDMNQRPLPKGTKLEFQRGTTFWLTITGKPEKGWRTYPATRRAPEQIEPPSTLTIEAGTNFQPIYPIREKPEPSFHSDKAPKELADISLVYEGPFTWVQEAYVKPTATPGKTELPIKIFAQACSKECVQETHELKVPITIAAGPALPPSPELQKRLAIKPSEAQIVPIPKDMEPKGMGREGRRRNHPRLGEKRLGLSGR